MVAKMISELKFVPLLKIFRKLSPGSAIRENAVPLLSPYMWQGGQTPKLSPSIPRQWTGTCLP